MHNANSLPRLVYVADVPVRNTVGGMVLMYRLLHDYPPAKLMVMESSVWARQGGIPLSDVPYKLLRIGPGRLLTTRYSATYARFLYESAPLHAAYLYRRLRSFDPEAVLTVAHGWTWRAAALLAKHLNVPLHLVVHDDCRATFGFNGTSQRRADVHFGHVYRQARSRLCISPGMVQEYERRYGSPGCLLYPLRAPGTPPSDSPSPIRQHAKHPFTVAYAGSIHGTGYLRSLDLVAQALRTLCGRLELYTPRTRTTVAWATNHDNVHINDMLPATADLIASLRDRADILLVSTSFEQDDRTNVKTSFPSKLADYTATGLPLLIVSPPFSSAVQWAQSNSGVAEVVDALDVSALHSALHRLQSQPAYRELLGVRSLQVGSRDFSYEVVSDKFMTALAGIQ